MIVPIEIIVGGIWKRAHLPLAAQLQEVLTSLLQWEWYSEGRSLLVSCTATFYCSGGGILKNSILYVSLWKRTRLPFAVQLQEVITSLLQWEWLLEGRSPLVSCTATFYCSGDGILKNILVSLFFVSRR